MEKFEAVLQKDPTLPKIKIWHKLFACDPAMDFARQLGEKIDRIGDVLRINVSYFPDGNQRIVVPNPDCDGQNLVYITSYWHNDENKLIDLRAIQFLSERGARHLTVIIPFFGSATNERPETGFGQLYSNSGISIPYETVAIAATDAKILSCFGNGNTRVRILLYDLHTLANRFYFTASVNVVMDSCLPYALDKLRPYYDIIVCPDDGAQERVGEKRVLKAAEPEMLKDKKILIVDDLVRTGNTIGECAIQCKEYGAKDVIVFVPHAVFPNDDFVKFQPGEADRFSNAVSRFYTTSSVPHVSRKLDRQKFTVFDFAKIVANSKYF